MKVSERILKILEDSGITPYQVHKDTGISEGTFTNWKARPTSKVKSDTIITLAKYLGVSCDFLLLGENSPSVKDREAKALLPYKEIIDSYKNSSKKSRNLARAALDLPPEK
ncbi:helix-turn-helix domain-containing protein [Christensenella tenuis]|jgi:transcriptional regulator with XRE-family HTH domain|uniref:Helix-turn-helix transcriptional regulator n=1 Tax=Christensenella tenuis TaxID=2763033 RepID=A0ABR7EFQ0_9FIRM|nr:helix-turn-helix transcriptional regulator [Christensenella tenuis]MBC5648571.1 helix-turn-helix transcriptional regulator [Christensenella tenuis]